ncbi:hypothetical protein AAFF_G00212240 [Aldrovandia affinis]|uniref:Uncharacterized protein n=1 Tax=Aldrovandia affinis TaxID=143900 RepID=A0AAD7RH65_9TELE|nr:hypothetical protein AAFF_G00212240 [Aldrovandia affinis]
MYKTSTRRVTRTFGKLKEQYERASGEQATAESLEMSIQNELKKLEEDKKKLVEESYQHIVSLDKIALKPESQSTLQHLDFLIERLKETGNAEQVQKLEEMKKRAQIVPKVK